MASNFAPAKSNVVPETTDISEDTFHGAMVEGLGRAEKKVGSKALAFVMDVTTKQLKNIFAGSAPHPKRLWDARAADPTVLDNIAGLYGCQIVAKGAGTTADLGTVPIAALLAKVAEAEDPAGPGGVAKTHQELLGMEENIRAVHALTGGWIEQINAIRTPRVVRG